MIYLLTAIGLSPGGSITVHIYTQTIYRTTQITTNLIECEPCPVFAKFTLAFALQLRKKHGESSTRVRKTSVRVQYILPKHSHITKPTHTHTPTYIRPDSHTQTHIHTRPHHTHTHTHTHPTHTRPHTTEPSYTQTHIHTLQNNIKLQYKLKKTQCKIYPNEVLTI